MVKGNSHVEVQNYTKQPFLLSVEEVLQHLETNPDLGLSSAQVQHHQQKYGKNEIEGEGGVKWHALLIKQVSNAMIMVLVLAMALSYSVTDYIEGGVITAVIVLNVAIGFYQEYDAEKKMDSLRSLSSPSATVVRNGSSITIPSAEVVPGDIVSIKMGDTVPADLRMFEVMNLECDESNLTGEALPVAKAVDFEPEHVSKEDCGAGDRLNIAYSACTVTKGRGRGIAVYTGMSTLYGGIAASMRKGAERKSNRSMSRKHRPMQNVKGAGLRVWDMVGNFLGLRKGTPLQIKLSKLAYVLFGVALILAITVFGVNRFKVTSEVAIYAISTGIAIIPESLIAVLTVTFVVGMTQMRKRKAVVRQLNALEALGGITNICSDKTGTLTQGKMVTRQVWVPGTGVYSVMNSDDASNPTRGSVTLEAARPWGTADEAGKAAPAEQRERQRRVVEHPSGLLAGRSEQDSAPKFTAPDSQDNLEITPGFAAFLESTALCNLATVRQVHGDSQEEWKTAGDPTEIALQVFSHRFGYGKKTLERVRGWKQTMEFPFDSSVKRMSVVYKRPGDSKSIIFTKGAVERVIDLCSSVGVGHVPDRQVMTDELKDTISKQMALFAAEGLRVLAIARRFSNEEIHEHSEIDRASIEQDLCFLGLAGIYDPPRLETKGAVQACTIAGISVHMLTGDHPATARAIAIEVGIIPRDVGVLPPDVAAAIVKPANEFDAMSDAEIDALPTLPLVIARCAPDTKVRMIEALHRRTKFVAMTGDGVNDAPSLRRADVGIAMGLNGSDVAKNASDIVLTDDNFASIVNAIEEGRRLFDNIQKFILHLLASNVGEVILLVCGLGFQDKLGFSVFPLSPLAILWINMLTSSFPAFGLGQEKAGSDIMRRPPHNARKGVFTWQVITDMLVYGIIMGTCTLMTFILIIYGPGPDGLGDDCNKGYNASCDVVFRARAAVFAELTWMILIAAWEFKSLRRSMFALDPDNSTSQFPFFKDVCANQFLFWSVVVGALSVFPAVYIPGLNTKVFKHKGISWEWAVAIISVIIFVSSIETWKLVKRTTGWFAEAKTESLKRREEDGDWTRDWSSHIGRSQSGGG